MEPATKTFGFSRKHATSSHVSVPPSVRVSRPSGLGSRPCGPLGRGQHGSPVPQALGKSMKAGAGLIQALSQGLSDQFWRPKQLIFKVGHSVSQLDMLHIAVKGLLACSSAS